VLCDPRFRDRFVRVGVNSSPAPIPSFLFTETVSTGLALAIRCGDEEWMVLVFGPALEFSDFDDSEFDLNR